jgi:hypothetical protein
MLFVSRDDDGKIVSIHEKAVEGATEEVSAYSKEVLDFLLGSGTEEASAEYLSYTDLQLSRVIEDLIDLLIEKNLIMLTELPAGAQLKLSRRQKAREQLQSKSPLIVDDDDIL